MATQEEIIKEQLLIVQGYYNRIYSQRPSLETILNWLEDDLQTLRMDTALTAATDILNESQSKGWREVLQELAELKDMKDEIDIRQINDPGISEENRNERLSMIDEYLKRKPLAWEAARKLLKNNQ